MCIIISFALVSCSNNTSSENKISSKNNNQIVSEKKTDTLIKLFYMKIISKKSLTITFHFK